MASQKNIAFKAASPIATLYTKGWNSQSLFWEWKRERERDTHEWSNRAQKLLCSTIFFWKKINLKIKNRKSKKNSKGEISRFIIMKNQKAKGICLAPMNNMYNFLKLGCSFSKIKTYFCLVMIIIMILVGVFIFPTCVT